jgi:methionine-rich copper-binding protein CopC
MIMRYLRFALPFIIFCLVPAATVDAHAFLDHANPGVGSKVHGSPAEVRVWFTEKLEAAFSKLQVFDQAGQEVGSHNLRLDPHDAAVLIVSVPVLEPGVYKVTWRAVSVDTHATEGSFKFEVLR